MNLTEYVKEVSLEDFGLHFTHQAYWNKRLKTTGGRFFPSQGHLDFNPKVLEIKGKAIFRQIVRHELCHYHLYFQNKGYRHCDADFKLLLKQVDGLRYTPTLLPQKSYSYRCSSCLMVYRRKYRLNLKRYRCGACRGALLAEKSVPSRMTSAY